jgi:hypothetical protein
VIQQCPAWIKVCDMMKAVFETWCAIGGLNDLLPTRCFIHAGGISVNSTLHLTNLDDKMITRILQEYKIHKWVPNFWLAIRHEHPHAKPALLVAELLVAEQFNTCCSTLTVAASFCSRKIQLLMIWLILLRYDCSTKALCFIPCYILSFKVLSCINLRWQPFVSQQSGRMLCFWSWPHLQSIST